MWDIVRTQEMLFPRYPPLFKPAFLYSHSNLPININRCKRIDHIYYIDKKRVKDVSQGNGKKSKNLTISRLRKPVHIVSFNNVLDILMRGSTILWSFPIPTKFKTGVISNVCIYETIKKQNHLAICKPMKRLFPNTEKQNTILFFLILYVQWLIHFIFTIQMESSINAMLKFSRLIKGMPKITQIFLFSSFKSSLIAIYYLIPNCSQIYKWERQTPNILSCII